MEYQNITKVSKKIQNKIIQWLLQMRMIEEYLKKGLEKDIYFQKKSKTNIDNLVFNTTV